MSEMFLRSSGKHGFKLLSSVETHESNQRIPKEKLLEMLKAEVTMRCSKEYQTLYTQQDTAEWLLEVETKLQKQLLIDFDMTECSVSKYRSQRGLYKDDNDIRDAAIYIKYDRSFSGVLSVGDIAPDVGLVTLEEKKVTLYELMRLEEEKPCVIIAGSHT